ncbi:hypothetical protein COV11_01615 [Candidatus Woesearchaeota archaeon CG10_big_fil_rev_8_21_14_0_10_30_7]|nr:MAG: hypothetical protein COV11_01615 [Candidatus Woesearchaeota archaeon CG10_big_fil_rev_8_21_14_0_10_30_7]
MKKTNQVLFMILILLGVLIKIKFLLLNNALWWDASVYIGMAKSFVDTGGLWEPLRPLIWPLILASIMLFKVNTIFVAKIIQLIFSLGSAYLVYVIGKRFFGINEAKIASLLLLFTPVITFYEGILLTEIPAVFFGLLTLYFFINEDYFLAGLSSGLSFLTKFPTGLLIIGLLIVTLGKNKQLFKVAGGFIIPLFFFLVSNYFWYGDLFLPLKDGMNVFAKSSWAYNEGLLFYLIGFFKENVFFILGIIGLFCLKKKREHLLLILFFLLPFLYFGYITHKEVRFYILFLPFLCLLSAKGITKLFEYKYLDLILLVLLLIFIPVSYGKFVDYYNFKVETESYYNLVNELGIKGKILVSDPRFVLLTDKKLIPLYYENYDELKVMDKLKNANLVFINSCDMVCEPNTDCELVQEKMQDYLEKNMTVYKTEQKKDCEFKVYI